MIGGKTKKDKSKSKIRLFSKYKTFKFERRNNDDFKHEKFLRSKGKMVRFTDHLSATG